MKKLCDYCNEEIEIKNRHSFGGHRAFCKSNPKYLEIKEKRKVSNKINNPPAKKIKLISYCTKCKNIFIQDVTISQIKRNRIMIFCSQSCANKRIHTEETKQKISNGLKLSLKNKKEYCEIKFQKCIYCDEIISIRKNKKTLHCKNCHSKHMSISCKGKCGGVREKGGWGKRGRIGEYYFQSTWEAAFIIYHLDHNIPFVRNTKGFEYFINDEKHKFFPDFIYEDGTYVEVKGRRTLDDLDEKNQAKLNGFTLPLILLQNEEMENMLYYYRKFYGKEFWKNDIEKTENKKLKIKNPIKFSDEHKRKLSEKGKGNSNAKGSKRIKVICPHCGKEGAYNSMIRWHFDNCKNK